MKILSIGYALPSKKVTNEDILEEVERKSSKHLKPEELKKLKKDISVLFERAGTKIRYHRAKGEKSLDFGIKAGEQALAKAGMSANDIDLLLYVGIGRGWIEPATSNVFIDTLKLKNATGYDIIDACASWLRAYQSAHLYIKNGIYKNIMIVNCEFNFHEYCSMEFRSLKEIDYLFPGATIGEAATATILTADSENEHYFTFKTWAEKHNLCKIPLPNLNQFNDGEFVSDFQPLLFYSFGERLFKIALPKIARHYSGDEYLKTLPYDIVFSHAASEAMSEKVFIAAKVDVSKSYSTHATHGNTVSCSVPLGMGLAIDDGSFKKGHNALIGFGSAGFSSAWCWFSNK